MAQPPMDTTKALTFASETLVKHDEGETVSSQLVNLAEAFLATKIELFPEFLRSDEDVSFQLVNLAKAYLATKLPQNHPDSPFKEP